MYQCHVVFLQRFFFHLQKSGGIILFWFCWIFFGASQASKKPPGPNSTCLVSLAVIATVDGSEIRRSPVNIGVYPKWLLRISSRGQGYQLPLQNRSFFAKVDCVAKNFQTPMMCLGCYDTLELCRNILGVLKDRNKATQKLYPIGSYRIHVWYMNVYECKYTIPWSHGHNCLKLTLSETKISCTCVLLLVDFATFYHEIQHQLAAAHFFGNFFLNRQKVAFRNLHRFHRWKTNPLASFGGRRPSW